MEDDEVSVFTPSESPGVRSCLVLPGPGHSVLPTVLTGWAI